ncbi:MAG TPA: methyltransferase domain-containing protein, partial [Pseudonocardiaceae bacterium]
VGDVYQLNYPGGTFDVVHAHQVLQHLTEPVAALREMRRVCKPDGYVAARDADFAAMAWYPPQDRLDRWLDLYRRVAYSNRTEPDAGRRLLAWARAAEFGNIACSATAWCFATPEQRAWWGGLWAERVTSSTLADQVLDRHLATREDLEDIADGWRRWAERDDGWFTVLNGEVLCRG